MVSKPIFRDCFKFLGPECNDRNSCHRHGTCMYPKKHTEDEIDPYYKLPVIGYASAPCGYVFSEYLDQYFSDIYDAYDAAAADGIEKYTDLKLVATKPQFFPYLDGDELFHNILPEEEEFAKVAPKLSKMLDEVNLYIHTLKEENKPASYIAIPKRIELDNSLWDEVFKIYE